MQTELQKQQKRQSLKDQMLQHLYHKFIEMYKLKMDQIAVCCNMSLLTYNNVNWRYASFKNYKMTNSTFNA